jgi:hypothetical protein
MEIDGRGFLGIESATYGLRKSQNSNFFCFYGQHGSSDGYLMEQMIEKMFETVQLFLVF